jgi:hypothetical protein
MGFSHIAPAQGVAHSCFSKQKLQNNLKHFMQNCLVAP